MATTVAEFGISAEKTEFSGSSAEDVMYAKSFWQSIQLDPPIESRLVSSHTRQRLKSRQSVQSSHPSATYRPNLGDYPPKLTEFLTNAHQEEENAQWERLQELAKKKQETQMLLQKQRNHRLKKEEVSGHKGIKRPEPVPLAAESDPEEEDPRDCLKQMDNFDRENGFADGSESD